MQLHSLTICCVLTVAQANMNASFARQNLMAKVSQLKANKDWSSLSTPDGRVNIDSLMRK
jgi:hypothetical protein